MEEKDKDGAQPKPEEADKGNLTHLLLAHLMKDSDLVPLQDFFTAILRGVYHHPNSEVCSEAIKLVEGLEKFFNNNPIAFRAILCNGYMQLRQDIWTERKDENWRWQELLPLVSVMLKKIIEGWDAQPQGYTGFGFAALIKPRKWAMNADAASCFELMRRAYRSDHRFLNTEHLSPEELINPAINKEILNIFKEHLEKKDGYWRHAPLALVPWIIAAETPVDIAIMLEKARIRFSEPYLIIRELKYLDALGYHQAPPEEEKFLLSVAAPRKKMTQLAAELVYYLQSQWSAEIAKRMELYQGPLITVKEEEIRTTILVSFATMTRLPCSMIDGFIAKLQEEIKTRRQVIFGDAVNHPRARQLMCKIEQEGFKDNCGGYDQRNLSIDCWDDTITNIPTRLHLYDVKGKK
jgi:hypothetical protein